MRDPVPDGAHATRGSSSGGQADNEAPAARRGVRVDVALHAPGEPTRESQSQPGAAVTVCAPRGTSHSWLEDSLPLVVLPPRAVVLDRVDDRRVFTRHRDMNAVRSVEEGVVDD